jgi:hypothetical protein
MSKLVYRVVRHDGGWAYEANRTFSETFRTREEARKAARLAAHEQQASGTSTPIDYRDESGRRHHEILSDRPETEVKR